jgi:hypothetical protein
MGDAMIVKAVRFNGSGVINAGACLLCGFLLGTDGVNDPTLTFYNAQAATAETDVVPTTTFEASTYGLSGFMPGEVAIDCPNGLYVEVANMGTGEGVVYVRAM